MKQGSHIHEGIIEVYVYILSPGTCVGVTWFGAAALVVSHKYILTGVIIFYTVINRLTKLSG